MAVIIVCLISFEVNSRINQGVKNVNPAVDTTRRTNYPSHTSVITMKLQGAILLISNPVLLVRYTYGVDAARLAWRLQITLKNDKFASLLLYLLFRFWKANSGTILDEREYLETYT